MSKSKINTEDFIDDLCGVDPQFQSEIESLEQKYKCTISCKIEKHNSLQYTYFFEADFGFDELFYAEIESGINNGTQVNNAEWGYNTKMLNRTVQVLEDIILDVNFYKKGSTLERKAKAVLSANKSKLFLWHRQNDYDNYVTGGNSKMKLDSLLSKLRLEYVYKEKEVDCNFI